MRWPKQQTLKTKNMKASGNRARHQQNEYAKQENLGLREENILQNARYNMYKEISQQLSSTS